MIHTITGFIVAGLAWLAWELVGEALGEAAWWSTRSIRGRIWRVLVEASWPWPLLLALLFGFGAALAGWSQVDIELPEWRRLSGLLAFMGGGVIILFTLVLWRDVRRERENGQSRSGV